MINQHKMHNPLEKIDLKNTDFELVKSSLNGDRIALDKLIKKHQPFIYNVAWKMSHNPNDAKDLTQEVLIKVITNLSKFSFKSAFPTWLYRIVVNEFLQTKRKNKNPQFESFEHYGNTLDNIPNPELNKQEEIAYAELSKEMQISCMSGMLMCLNEEQRLIYILGDTFNIDHNLGAEIFEISPQNFRIKLHRSRKELYNFMNNKCGLVNKANPCRCPKKTKALKKIGFLNENKMLFNVKTAKKIKDFASENHVELMETIEDKYTLLFRNHPAKKHFGKETIIDELLNDDDLMKHLRP
ncbi:ECF RNA polymerase sigma factor SigH [Flagellimonas maritima]|uniref:ECF RNA polymerase sigma factor SigH n=2 Tax=Flagellimonas maritima TaxID=1383885 RepID=A0A2Z4LR91_9FLAO|nr:ECF RNA polymerase sigma factor SigH [Allomuricauda aurantiaca]